MSFLRAISKTFGLGGRHVKMSPNNVVFITGCDSGLGYALSVYCHSLNMTVISACHNVQSKGARLLQHLNEPKRMITFELDLLNQENIVQAQQYISELMTQNSNYEFTALVNNAGVMCFGEFEWQTHKQIDMQIQVNVLGTMHLTKAMLPLVRQHRARIINVTSHCGLHALPVLAPYAASKAGLRFWNDTLRIEMQQYGVEVINFVPGSFVTATNICARQQQHAEDMQKHFTQEQEQFYGVYFRKLNEYLRIISGFKGPNQVQDAILLAKFKDALTNTQPKAMYIHETWRYKFYRMLFLICPTPIVDWLTIKFCAMPTYQTVTTAAVAAASANHIQKS